MTTSHVFQPNERRNTVLSLRFWLPNCDFLSERLDRTPGRGGSPTHALESALTEKLTRNFLPNGSPAVHGGFKKNRPQRRRRAGM